MEKNQISTLTIEEFSFLMLNILSQNREIIKSENLLNVYQPPNETDVKSILWVAENCNLKPSTIRSMVSRCTIPCLSRKKPLQFSAKAITEWMENGRKKPEVVIDFTPKRKK